MSQDSPDSMSMISLATEDSWACRTRTLEDVDPGNELKTFSICSFVRPDKHPLNEAVLFTLSAPNKFIAASKFAY